MTRSRLILLAIFIVFAPAAAVSQKVSRETIVSEGKRRSYYIYVPEKLNPSVQVPLLVLLHGSNRNGLSLVEKWTDLAKQERVILLGRDSADSSHWSVPGDGPTFLHELVEAIKAKYPINPNKVYLFGHSGGAESGRILAEVS